MFKKINNHLLICVINKKKNLPIYYKKKINPVKIKNIKVNYTLFFIDDKNFKKIFVNFYLNIFNNKYLKNLYNLNFKEKNINCLDIIPQNIKKNLIYQTQSVSFKQFGVKYFNEVAFLFVTNIFVKNCKNICIFIKKSLDSVHFKKHRLYFFFFFNILSNYIEPFFKELKVKGFCLIFKGKLAKGGNSRKQTLFYKRGLYSLSNKNLKIEKNKWDIWTKTGSVGCTFQIFYKKYDNFCKYLFIYIFNHFNSFAVFIIRL